MNDFVMINEVTCGMGAPFNASAPEYAGTGTNHGLQARAFIMAAPAPRSVRLGVGP